MTSTDQTKGAQPRRKAPLTWPSDICLIERMGGVAGTASRLTADGWRSPSRDVSRSCVARENRRRRRVTGVSASGSAPGPRKPTPDRRGSLRSRCGDGEYGLGPPAPLCRPAESCGCVRRARLPLPWSPLAAKWLARARRALARNRGRRGPPLAGVIAVTVLGAFASSRRLLPASCSLLIGLLGAVSSVAPTAGTTGPRARRFARARGRRGRCGGRTPRSCARAAPAARSSPSHDGELTMPRSGASATNRSENATSSRHACHASATTAASATAPSKSPSGSAGE